MIFKKAITMSIFLLVPFLVTQPAFSQGTGERAVSFGGFIESIPKDLKYIVVYEGRVFAADARIVDETGNPLKVSDLKPDLYVTVEGVQRSKDIYAKKITLNRSRKPPSQ